MPLRLQQTTLVLTFFQASELELKPLSKYFMTFFVPIIQRCDATEIFPLNQLPRYMWKLGVKQMADGSGRNKNPNRTLNDRNISFCFLF